MVCASRTICLTRIASEQGFSGSSICRSYGLPCSHCPGAAERTSMRTVHPISLSSVLALCALSLGCASAKAPPQSAAEAEKPAPAQAGASLKAAALSAEPAPHEAAAPSEASKPADEPRDGLRKASR